MPTPTNPITSIKTYFENHNGLQLANRFSVSFAGLPGGISIGDNSDGFVQAEYMALGPRALNTVQDNLNGFGFGRFVPRSQDLLSGGFGVQLIFPVTNDHHLIKFFNDWFSYFYKSPRQAGGNPLNVYKIPYYNDAVRPVTMTVNMLNPNGGVNNSITFYEVFPVETQPIEMSMAFTDKYLKYAVTFAYRDFVQTIGIQTPSSPEG
jgi:hypothetical protein